jgi:AcrR family transcriptional regulator
MSQATSENPRIARTRERVIRSATDLLVEGGPWAVTVDAVVARSGVAKSTIYRHWESRDELLVDILASCAPEIGPPPPELSAADALRDVLSKAAAVMRDPDTGPVVPMLLMLKSQLKGVADLETELENHQIALIDDLLARGVREGVLPEGLDPHLVAAQLFGPMLFAHLTDMVPVTDAFAGAIVDAFLAAHRVPK